ncbi:hypothetical protein [Pendulispora albinea]|uniref:Uncharacterized protein n=1 Tax=Pendulispora albinea TaxID=2741071 RepID=A0ABZ2LRT9_9BACT
MNSDFPTGVWGIVSKADPENAQIEKVRIDHSKPSGYIIVTKEPKGTFDVWVETEAEVTDFLKAMVVRWENTA